MIRLNIIKNTDPRLRDMMARHYSNPAGFVGRNICYAIYFNNIFYGCIVGGSSTRFLPGRNEYFGISISQLNNIVNNTFYHIEKVNEKYPIRNFTSEVVRQFVKQCSIDWYLKYHDEVIGFETLVELPRSGELYIKAKWDYLGETKGYTCKRVAGNGTDNWTGKRIWDTDNLRPKKVFAVKVNCNYENLGQLSFLQGEINA